ncbi:hypothetical protein PInf_016532 [Phytophthora infestans]|nr:hypothetical protein PInf_016532 [Phytophthora infestans]
MLTDCLQKVYSLQTLQTTSTQAGPTVKSVTFQPVEILEEEEEEVRAERAPGGDTPQRPQGRERQGDGEERGTPQRANPETGEYEVRTVHVEGEDMFDAASSSPRTRRTVKPVSGTPLRGQMSNTVLEQWTRQPAPSKGTTPARTTMDTPMEASVMDS